MKIFQTKDKKTHSLEQTERTLDHDFRPDIPQSLQLWQLASEITFELPKGKKKSYCT